MERIAEDAACITVEIPEALNDAFAFHAGQYVTVRRMIEGREERRTYSIVTPPGARTLKLGVRRQLHGRVSSELTSELRPGDSLEVAPPMGRFRTAIAAQRRYSYVAFAAGSGITPVLSLAADILAREPRSRFTLIYGNRNMARTMFIEETLALKNLYMERFAVHFVMSREPQQTAWLNGRIDGAKITEIAAHLPEIASADEYLVCGPGDMVDAVRAAIKAFNAEAPIRLERFAAGAARPAGALHAAVAPDVQAESLATITVVMDGRSRSFPMAARDESVLVAAERAGLELPFSCRSGICATCRTRITEGAAVMAHNIALEPWEIAAGFVLCCQARPTTASLSISYDQK